MVEQEVARLAARIRAQHWKETGKPGSGTRLSTAVTRAWQDAVLVKYGVRFRFEVPVADGLQNRIDLLDMARMAAYELKVSANNPHHELFRDIFKIAAYNANATSKIKKLVFLAAAKAIKDLKAGLGGIAPRLSVPLGFKVVLRAL